MTDQTPLEKVRADFAAFETSETIYTSRETDHLIRDIKNGLKTAGAKWADLDATGQSSDAQMEDRLKKAITNACLRTARNEFEAIEASYLMDSGANLTDTYHSIMGRLALAHSGLGALDPTGQSTDEQMKERLTKALARANLQSARVRLIEFEKSEEPHHIDTIRCIEGLVRGDLERGGVTAKSLDPFGTSTDEEMNARLKKASARAYVRSARSYLAWLEDDTKARDPYQVRYAEKDIRRALELAGLPLASLDPEGKSDDAAMEKRLKKAVAHAQKLPDPTEKKPGLAERFSRAVKRPFSGIGAKLPRIGGKKKKPEEPTAS